MTFILLEHFALRLALAFVLGAVVGLERQYRQKSAGLLTNTLVSLGSASFILLSLSLTDDSGDPSRVAGQIVTGIGFLGAGVIMKNGTNVQGLNTAATIWCSAALGTLAGAGLYWQAVIMCFAIVFSHIFLRPIGILLNRLPHKKEETGRYFYSIKIRCKAQVENHVRVMMLHSFRDKETLFLRSLKSTDDGSPELALIEAQIMAYKPQDTAIEQLAGKLTLEFGVSGVAWRVSDQEEND